MKTEHKYITGETQFFVSNGVNLKQIIQQMASYTHPNCSLTF